MTTHKSIQIIKKSNSYRNVIINLGYGEIKNSGFLSDFDLDSITEIIIELTKVINGTLESFY